MSDETRKPVEPWQVREARRLKGIRENTRDGAGMSAEAAGFVLGLLDEARELHQKTSKAYWNERDRTEKAEQDARRQKVYADLAFALRDDQAEALEYAMRTYRAAEKALENIANPKNWPASVRHGEAIVPDDLITWMQAVAVSALTGKKP